jgi:HK97 family phage prohead protease
MAVETSTVPDEEAGVSVQPPKENIVRAVMPGGEFRADESAAGKVGTLNGHFAVFSEFTEINSVWEGRFMEQIAPGAFKKTFSENRSSMKVLFDHGQDPSVGSKPLGPISDLREDDTGAFYEVDLIDTSYTRDLVPGLRAGLYGASFRFRVIREDLNNDPAASDSNPDRLPERTIREAQVMEFGPVVFPAYQGATAGVRSMTDDYIFQQFRAHPDKLRELLNHFQLDTAEAAIQPENTGQTTAPSEPTPPDRAPQQERRVHRFESREEWLQWMQSI